MCKFFSFVTEPENHGGKRFYFDWTRRKKDFDGADSHDHIIQTSKLNGNICNTYEYNPLTKVFQIDQINSQTNDSVQAEDWVRGLDLKKIVKPLIIKPIGHPFNDIEKVRKVRKVTPEQIHLLVEWASVGASMGDSMWGIPWRIP